MNKSLLQKDYFPTKKAPDKLREIVFSRVGINNKYSLLKKIKFHFSNFAVLFIFFLLGFFTMFFLFIGYKSSVKNDFEDKSNLSLNLLEAENNNIENTLDSLEMILSLVENDLDIEF